MHWEVGQWDMACRTDLLLERPSSDSSSSVAGFSLLPWAPFFLDELAVFVALDDWSFKSVSGVSCRLLNSFGERPANLCLPFAAFLFRVAGAMVDVIGPVPQY
jgi:hypothetical protein